MIFYMITLVGIMCFYGIILNVSMSHESVGISSAILNNVTASTYNCGPFESNTVAGDYAFDYLDNYMMYICSI